MSKMHIVQAARGLRDSIRPAEDAVDHALSNLGRLLSSACDARVATGVPASVGRSAIDEIVASTALMGEVRGRILTAHGHMLTEVRTQLPELGFGDLGDCDPQGASQAKPPTLRSVA